MGFAPHLDATSTHSQDMHKCSSDAARPIGGLWHLGEHAQHSIDVGCVAHIGNARYVCVPDDATCGPATPWTATALTRLAKACQGLPRLAKACQGLPMACQGLLRLAKASFCQGFGSPRRNREIGSIVLHEG